MIKTITKYPILLGVIGGLIIVGGIILLAAFNSPSKNKHHSSLNVTQLRIHPQRFYIQDTGYIIIGDSLLFLIKVDTLTFQVSRIGEYRINKIIK